EGTFSSPSRDEEILTSIHSPAGLISFARRLGGGRAERPLHTGGGGLLGDAPLSFNLDFHAIPFPGAEPDLENHRVPTRNRALPAVMAQYQRSCHGVPSGSVTRLNRTSESDSSRPMAHDTRRSRPAIHLSHLPRIRVPSSVSHPRGWGGDRETTL